MALFHLFSDCAHSSNTIALRRGKNHVANCVGVFYLIEPIRFFGNEYHF